jgi:hypothetical protein
LFDSDGKAFLVATIFIFSLLLRFLIVAYVRKPFLAKVRELSYPIPVELPVTTATLSAGEEEVIINITINITDTSYYLSW